MRMYHILLSLSKICSTLMIICKSYIIIIIGLQNFPYSIIGVSQN